MMLHSIEAKVTMLETSNFFLPTHNLFWEILYVRTKSLQARIVLRLLHGLQTFAELLYAFFPTCRCLGVILLHPTANASTIMDNFKDKFQKLKIKTTGENIVTEAV